MSDSKETTETGDAALWVVRRDHDLRARFEHLRALNSAWAVLAPFGLSDEGQHIVEAGRAVSTELAELARQPFEDRDESALSKLDKLLDVIKDDMLALALGVPVAEFRSTLPARLPVERRGVLDLLDLMLIAQIEGHQDPAGRISAIDYLITLLTTGGPHGDGNVLLDPVGLTPRLHALCVRADADDDPRLAEIEAEFHAAAKMCDEEEARDEVRQRVLRRRKRELGASYFAPGVLRAIVANNAALSNLINHGVSDSRDWGSLPGGAEQSGGDESVFETEALPRLAEALRRRAQGAAPSSSAIDRVAWCVDLTSLAGDERAALLSPSVGRPGDLQGTTILVGLLSRAAVVLESEFPAIGIVPERLSSDWVRELDDVLKQEVKQRLAGNAYKEACILSELRTRFLYSLKSDERRLKSDERREPRRVQPEAKPSGRQTVAQEARHLADEALGSPPAKTRRPPRQARTETGTRPSWSRARFGQFGAAALLMGVLAWALVPSGDLDGFSRAELDRVSPYLAAGARNGEGQGPAFVGTLVDAWAQIAPDQQEQAATQLVEALRTQGVREIMVYDDERRLRIQALGEQSVRVLSAASP